MASLEPNHVQEHSNTLQFRITRHGTRNPSATRAKGNELSDLPPLPETPLGRYRHYKGNDYEVLGVARHTETLEITAGKPTISVLTMLLKVI